ncbi:hypothetical protein Godav_011016, partial [Gossypium davidsonii]|nr:hypothetical protein [Gossypium davidsonii]
MASTPYEYDIFQQHTFEDNIISQSHDIASQFINIELTIDFVFIPVHHDFSVDITITNHTLRINTASLAYHYFVNEIFVRGMRSIGTNREVLPLRSVIHVSIMDSDGVSMGRALAESALEFESSNYGMVPAKESLVKKTVRMVRVEDGDQEDCMICLEELEVGSHTF